MDLAPSSPTGLQRFHRLGAVAMLLLAAWIALRGDLLQADLTWRRQFLQQFGSALTVGILMVGGGWARTFAVRVTLAVLAGLAFVGASGLQWTAGHYGSAALLVPQLALLAWLSRRTPVRDLVPPAS